MKLVLIFLALWISLLFRYSYIVCPLLAILLLIYAFRKYKKRFGLALIAVMSIGTLYSFMNIDVTKEDDTYEGIVIESKSNYFIFYTNLERVYVYNKDNTYEVGDSLIIYGEKTPYTSTVLESEFDFGDYLNKKGVRNSLTISSVEVKSEAPIRINTLKNNFLSNFDEDTQGFISSLFFSDSSDSALGTTLDTLHLSRFASASGIFIYAFLNFVTFLIGMFVKKKWAKVISFGLLMPYFILLFPHFSIIRICSLYIFRWINDYCLHKRFTNLETTAIVGIFCLLINHYLARQDSFILGFMLPIGASLINSLFYRMRSKIGRRVASTLVMGVFFIPFEISFYGSVGLLTYAFTLILQPFFVLLSLLTLLCYYRVPIYGAVNGYTSLLNTMCSGLTKINPIFYTPELSAVGLVIFYALFFAVAYFFLAKHRPMFRLSLSLSALLLVGMLFPIDNMFTAEVIFINVGQGDSTLVRYHNSAVLIDTGGLYYEDTATEILIPLLKKEKIYSLDCVFITHQDFDHNGGLSSLEENFKVKNVMSYYDSFPVTYGGVTYYNYNTDGYTYEEENDRSLVLGFNVCDKDFLIMGDATTTVEWSLMKQYDSIPCDILKVGHHGSSTSTSPEWVEYLEPEEAIISCGVNNRYGHPTEQTLTTLYNAGVTVRRTDLEGSIRYSSFCV